MTGIEIPHDRTLNQPSTAFCRNPACREVSNQEFHFRVENDLFACPKCGADRSPMVGLLVLTHLLIPDAMGPVRGKGNRGYKIACDNKRAYLATVTNQEAATDNPKVANCPGCLEQVSKQGIKENTGKKLILKPDSAPADQPEE